MPWTGGSTRQWRVTRERILRRDQYQCQLRIAGTCTEAADCVHHVNGKDAGDQDANLCAACTPCNLAIGDPTRDSEPQPVRRTRW